LSTDPSQKYNIEIAYKASLELAKSHYENFPVVSFLIPKNQRKHIAIIYWFARTADDLADEGEASEEERIIKLNEFYKRVIDIAAGVYKNNYDAALGETIKTNNLSSENLTNLLTAFKQDITKKRYKNFDEVLFYCKNSANPVGRLILELNKIQNEEAKKYSDQICTALQLTNFIQDIEVDYKKGRIYLPEEEMEKYGVEEKVFRLKENSDNLRELLKLSVVRIEQMFSEGRNLIPYLNGRIKFEIKWTILGGEKILEKVKKANYKIFGSRPTLSKLDYLNLLCKSIFIR